MATFVSDSFTDTDGTALESHTGETGATWTPHPSGTDTMRIQSGRLYLDGTNDGIYYASGVPASADYDVEATFVIVGTTADIAPRIAGRMDTTGLTYYMAGYSQFADQWDLFKFVGGAPTMLGSWPEALGVGSVRTARLEMRGTSIKLYVDGVERISATDGDVTAAGRAGLDVRGTGSATNGVHLDSFSATDAVTSVTGTGAATLPALTVSSAGSVEVDGTGAATLPAVQVTGAGAVPVEGTGSVQLPALTASGAGVVAVEGSASALLPALTLSGSGTVPVAGDGAAALPAVQVQASGGVGTFGTGAGTVPALTVTAVGVVNVQGDAALTLPALTLSATGRLDVDGVATLTLPALTITAAGGVPVMGTGGGTLPALRLEAAGSDVRRAALRLASWGLYPALSGAVSATPAMAGEAATAPALDATLSLEP